MNVLKYKDFEGTAEIDMDRAVCRGKVLFIDDLVTYEAASPRELQHEFEAAVDDYLETCEQLGRPPAKPFRGQFNVRIPAPLHRLAALRAVADSSSLNDVVVRALDSYLCSKAEVTHNVRITMEADQVKTVRASHERKDWGTANASVH